jgi:methionyl-tRNA synthetase
MRLFPRDTFGHLKCLLHIVFETLRVNGIILQPIIPKLSNVLLDRLGISKEERMVKHISLKTNQQRDTKLGQPINVLFPRIQQDEC